MHRRATDLLLPVLLLGAMGEAVLWEGGGRPAGRVGFAVLAALALAAAVRERPATAAVLLRRPVIVVLLALAVVGGLSALWTIGTPERTLRWALVTAGYAAVAVAAGVLARRPRGVAVIATAIAVLAFISGVVGLAGVAVSAGPFADRIAGAWRPGGTLEYSAALALLQVSALPVLLTAIVSRSPWARAGGLLGAAVAAAVLVLAASRLELALAAVVLVAGAALAARGRGWPAPAIAALVAGLLAVPAVAGAVASGDGGWHGRPAVWRAALDVMAEHPLGGTGADTFLLASLPHVNGDPVAYAHDLPLELGAELGAAGLLGALLLYGCTALAWWRARRSPAAWLLGPAAGAFLLASLVDWPWHLAGSGAAWAAAVGGLLGAADRRGAYCASPPHPCGAGIRAGTSTSAGRPHPVGET